MARVLVTAALGIFARVERPRVRTWLGLSLASLGVVTLTCVRDISVGNLLVTLNSLSYAAYLVLVGKHIRRGAVEFFLGRHLPSVTDRIVARTLAARVRSGAFAGAELSGALVERHTPPS